MSTKFVTRFQKLLKSNVNLQVLRNYASTVDLAYTIYEDKGTVSDKPPLFILHGVFGSKANFASLCKEYIFSVRRKIIAVDLRNHGESPHNPELSLEHCADDLKALKTKLKIDKCALLGHSLGGRIVMIYALKYQKLVEKLIVGDISPVVSEGSISFIPYYIELMTNLKYDQKLPLGQVRKELDKLLEKKIKEKGIRQFLLSNLAKGKDNKIKWRFNLKSIRDNYKNIAHFPVQSGITFTGPTLFIAAGDHQFVPKSHIPEIKKYFPNAEILWIPNTSHWLHAEKPKEFLEITSGFLNK